ncbi:MAG: hypothetical protein COZ70_01980 [Deltaproteobacteria bacterium CG_4_8_14_3_um_filter_51_11]|nr:MAG: hypothetical protein COX16_16400 [Deltaproteobacteria bacterium CG23_combo_of_CG06-09_8_20_14_all_51_20]PIX20732.1 MAG: hypothetical protein COZ70_01980 [Deltaproteobacteria bacterium CG_4_8_14_3_um_filter_51_11]
MHIGILSARSQRYHPNRRLIEAGSKLGHKVRLIHPGQCIASILSERIGFSGRKPDVSILIPRIGASINEYALAAVRHFQQAGVRVVNRFESILLARNKFCCMQTLASLGVSVPDSLFVSNLKNLETAIEKLGGFPVVVKTPSGRQGSGVMVLESRPVVEFLASNLTLSVTGLIVQRYIPAKGRRDIRAFVLGEDVIAAVELLPPRGDFRANVHVGGKATPIKIEPPLAELALKATRVLGLEISGTDILVDSTGHASVIEVNYSPGFRGLEASTGLDIALKIIEHAAGYKTGGN